MNKKYFKIAFIIVFISFVIFVIAKKINNDNSTMKSSIKEENKPSKIVENKIEDPRTKLENRSPILNNSINPIVETKENFIESKIKPIEKPVNTIIEDEEIISLTNEIKVENSNQTKPAEVNNILTNNKDAISKNTVNKIIDTISLKKDTIKPLPTESIEKINITTIKDLKEIKDQITINSTNQNFTYKEKEYQIGNKFGEFIIDKIYSKKIRFKINNKYYYNLRFFN